MESSDKEQEPPFKLPVVLQKNYWIYVLCLIILLVCLYSLATLKDYENKCNEHWTEQLKHCGCSCVDQRFNNWSKEELPWTNLNMSESKAR